MLIPAGTQPSRSVLIVDQSDDSREVLRTILQRRGVQILEANQGRRGLEIARDEHPDVIVFDIDATPSDDATPDDDLCADYADQADHDHASLVLLGTTRRRDAREPSAFLKKPYQYGPLIRKIEELLAQSEASSPTRKAA